MCPFIGFVNAVFFWNRVDSPPTNSINLTLLHIASNAWSRPRRRRGRGPLGLVVELLSTRNVSNRFKLLPWCCIRWSHTLMFSVFAHHSSLFTVCLLPPCSDTLSTHQWHHEIFPMSNLSALPVPLANQVSMFSVLLNRCAPVNVLTGAMLTA